MSRNKNWEKVYEAWKAENPDLTKEERGQFVRGCVAKMAYPDYLTALAACVALSKETPKKPRMHLGIYLCPMCLFNHIGNQKRPASQSDRDFFNPKWHTLITSLL